MAADLVELLKACDQQREPNLEKLAHQFALGEVEVNPDEEGGEGDGDEEEEEVEEATEES